MLYNKIIFSLHLHEYALNIYIYKQMCFLELIHSRNKFFSNFKTSILAVYSYIFASMYVRDLQVRKCYCSVFLVTDKFIVQAWKFLLMFSSNVLVVHFLFINFIIVVVIDIHLEVLTLHRMQVIKQNECKCILWVGYWNFAIELHKCFYSIVFFCFNTF